MLYNNYTHFYATNEKEIEVSTFKGNSIYISVNGQSTTNRLNITTQKNTELEAGIYSI